MKHSRPHPFLLSALAAAALSCQGRPGAEAPAPAPASTEPAAAAPESPAASDAAAAPESSAASDAAAGPEEPKVTPFGVPECDTYVRKYLDCVETRVSGEARDKLLESFEANRTRWRTLATMQQGAVALSVACKAATQKAKEALAVDYGCEF